MANVRYNAQLCSSNGSQFRSATLHPIGDVVHMRKGKRITDCIIVGRESMGRGVYKYRTQPIVEYREQA
jgi:hypothetical protein